MGVLQVVLFLMLFAVALGWVARHFKFPYPIALVIGGGLLGFVPRLPQPQFDPQFTLVLVLPPILYQAALLTSWREFKANVRPIGLLAIGLVLATTLAVGATLKLLIPDIPWAAAFTLGAIVSPPTWWLRPRSCRGSTSRARWSRCSRARAWSTTPPGW